MKRLIAFLTAAIMVVSLASCGGNNTTTSTEKVATDYIADTVATAVVPAAATEVIPAAAPGPAHRRRSGRRSRQRRCSGASATPTGTTKSSPIPPLQRGGSWTTSTTAR